GGTFDGIELLVPKNVPPARGSSMNGLAGTLNANGLGVRTTGGLGHTNLFLFGGFHVSGPWSFDRHGHVSGHFLEVASDRVTCSTNTISTSTNVAVEANPVFATNFFGNSFGNSFCLTLPIQTNMIPGSYSNQVICYLNRVLVSTNIFTFISTNAIFATNTLPDGSFCETIPI